MNDTEQKRLYVGLVVTALIIGAFLAVLLGGRSGGIRGEHLLLTELPTGRKITAGTPVVMEGGQIGEVTKVYRMGAENKTAVRMRVGPEAFRKVGEDAAARLETGDDDRPVIRIYPGKKPSSRRLITIKPVKGLGINPIEQGGSSTP